MLCEVDSKKIDNNLIQRTAFGPQLTLHVRPYAVVLMKISSIVIGCVVIGFVVFLFATRRTNSPVGKPCSVCGVRSSYGYSEHAEEFADKIKPLCLAHLISELESNYHSFRGRAVVIEPTDGPPCYVFQPVDDWRQAFKDSKIADDVLSLLAKMETKCHDCGQKANFLWVESNGLTGDNFGETLDKGVTATLLSQNPALISLCPKCCVKLIARALETKRLSYLEVCAPKGKVDGFVIPMGY